MANSDDPLFNKKRQLNKRGKRSSVQWRHKLTPKDYNLEDTWQEEADPSPQSNSQQTPKKKTLGILWVFLAVAFLFFIGAAIFAYVSFTKGKVGIRPDAIVISTEYPVSIASGELFEIDFTIENKNQLPIEAVELVLEYPEGTTAADTITEEVRRERVFLGDLKAGAFVQHTEAVRFFGENDQRLDIGASIEYKVPASGAIFEIPRKIEARLTSAPVRITLDALESLTAGQTITFDISVQSNAAETLENIIINANYPFGFSYIDSDFDPVFSDHIWKIDTLAPNEVQDFTIRGSLAGQNKEERRFYFEVGIENVERENVIGVALSDLEHFVKISKPFLDFDILFGDDNSDVIVRNSADELGGRVMLRNTTSQAIRDVEVRLTLNEPIYDKFRVEAQNGFFDSAAGVLKWNEQTLEQLSLIAPGEIRELGFGVKLLSSVREDGSINKNPELTLSAMITAERSSEQGADEEINTSTLKKVILQTIPVITASSVYDSSAFENYGPTPPKVETETTYEVSYDLRNSSSDIQNGRITTELPQYVVWKDAIFPENAPVTYNPETRVVTWDVGSLEAGVGYVSSARKVSFQVGLVPSASQVGDVPKLIEKTNFIGYDTYTETNVTAEAGFVTTQTGGMVSTGGARVQK